MGVAVYGVPQDGLRVASFFAVALFFGSCFGVASEIFSTPCMALCRVGLDVCVKTCMISLIPSEKNKPAK